MVVATEDPVGTLDTALLHARRLLAARPDLAERQAAEIIKTSPGHLAASVVLGAARRRQGDIAGALATLQQAARGAPRDAEAQVELGLVFASLGQQPEAIVYLRRATAADPQSSRAWRILAEQLTLTGDAAEADQAYAQAIRASVRDPALMQAALALCDGKLAIAERLLKGHLKQAPTDVSAIRMLAEVAARLGRFWDAEALLARCLELAPGFGAARHNYALVLHRQSKAQAALEQIEVLLEAEPDNPSYQFLKAAALARLGEYGASIAIYRAIVSRYPDTERGWLSLGHALKTAGEANESIAAYERAAEIGQHVGEAYWSLANMKTYRFSDAMVERMRTQLSRDGLADEERLHLHYALGKALEDRQEYAASFAHYEEGARLRRLSVPYNADDNAAAMARSRALFTADFFAARAGRGAAAADPIFIVGLPRAGSTLLEQILASHSAVEGTMELPNILMLARELGDGRANDTRYPDVLAGLSAEDLGALGARYIEATRVQRKTDKPFFIDKMPNNFQHVGLIHLILPNAKIIDARRHPMGCCFSAFKQHFARGQGFSYDLDDIGRYYGDYVALMQHFDAVLPGRIHRVIYEELVADPETQIRALLDYCALPFEAACLSFHETERAVRTASSEQVRRPLYADAVAHWRNYEPYLDALKAALGPVLDAYPHAPGGAR